RERREQPFGLAIGSNEKLWSQLGGRLGQHTAAELTQALPKNAWQRLSAGAGSKGERLYDWARLRLTRCSSRPGSIGCWSDAAVATPPISPTTSSSARPRPASPLSRGSLASA